MNRHFVTPSVCLLLVLAACGDDDGGGGVDAGRDAGRTDAGAIDAAVETDAGTDAAVETDAGATDAGTDAGVAPPSVPGEGDLVITEFMAAPVGYADDALAEWVEVHNPSTEESYELMGCVFSDKPADDDYTIAASVVIGPGEYITLSSADFTEATHGFVSDIVYGATGTGLSGTGDSPVIKCGGAVVDTVNYAATGFPVPDDMEGRAVQLDPGSLTASANDTGSNWCFATASFVTSMGMDNYGSPGEANADCPE